MPFGRYRGRPLSELPADYLNWLQSLPDLRQPLRCAILDEIERRGAHTPPRLHVSTCPHPEIARELIGAGIRSLARQYHPDAGGEHEQMIRVTAVADWLRERVEAA